MRKIERHLLVFATLAAGAAIGLNVLAYRHASAMMHFTRSGIRTRGPETLTTPEKIKVLFSGVEIPRPESSLSPTVLGSECRSVTLDVTNGVTLGAWYRPNQGDGPLVILFHGYTSEKTGTLPEAKAFLEMGASVLLVDFRGSGDSSESYTTIGYKEAEDVAAAVRYARNHLKYSRVVLYGQSMGGVAVLRAVHSGDIRPEAIIVEAVFDTMLNTVRHRFQAMGVPSFPAAQLLVLWGGRQAGFNGFNHNPVEYARSVKCPILFLHGSADPRARLDEARRVYGAVPGAKHFEEFSGIGHESAALRIPEQWNAVVSEFLTKRE